MMTTEHKPGCPARIEERGGHSLGICTCRDDKVAVAAYLGLTVEEMNTAPYELLQKLQGHVFNSEDREAEAIRSEIRTAEGGHQP